MEFLFISSLSSIIPWLVPVVVVSTVVAVKSRKSSLEKAARTANSVYAMEIEHEGQEREHRFRVTQIDRPQYGQSFNYYRGSGSYERKFSDPSAGGFDVLSAGNQTLPRDARNIGGPGQEKRAGIIGDPQAAKQLTPPPTEEDTTPAASVNNEPVEPDDPEKYQKRLERARARLSQKPTIDKTVRPYKDELGRRKLLKQMSEVLDVMKDQEQFMETTIQKAKDEGSRTAEELAEAEEAMAELRRGKIEMQTKIKIVIDDDFDKDKD